VTRAVKVEKKEDGYTLLDAEGNGLTISADEANLLFNYITDEIAMLNSDRIIERSKVLDITLSKREIEDIALRLRDEILSDELYWELEDKNIDYLIYQAQYESLHKLD